MKMWKIKDSQFQKNINLKKEKRIDHQALEKDGWNSKLNKFITNRSKHTNISHLKQIMYHISVGKGNITKRYLRSKK